MEKLSKSEFYLCRFFGRAEDAMIRKRNSVFSVYVLIAAACFLMGYSLFRTERTIETARSALYVFAHSVLPSLALFSVCSKLIVKLGVTKKLSAVPMRGFLRSVGMSAGGFAAFFVGLFSGFPTGAAMLAELCERGEISPREAESLLPFCNQAGIAFLLGTVGGAMLHDARMGLVFFLAQTATAWVCVCLTSHERQGYERSTASFVAADTSWISAVTASVRESAFSMLGICGFVVFFSLCGTALFDTASAIGIPVNGLLRSVVGGAMEISCGFLTLSQGNFPPKTVLLLGGVILGFGGCSVFLQAVEKTESFFFSPKKYFKGKLLASSICPIFCLLFFLLCQKEDGKNLIIVIFLLVLCISCFLNYVKIKFFSKKCGKMKRNAV